MLNVKLELDAGIPRIALTAGEVLWIDAPLLQSLNVLTVDGRENHAQLLEEEVSGLRVRGQLGPLILTRSFRQGDGFVEEEIALENPGNAAVDLESGMFGIQQAVADAAESSAEPYAKDRWVAIPFRRSPWNEKVQDWGVRELIAEPGLERRLDTYQQIHYIRNWQHQAEGFAWEHEEHCLGVYTGNEAGVQFSALAALARPEGVMIGMGAALPSLGEPGVPTTIPAGESLSCGTVRYVSLEGGHLEAMQAYRDWLDERGHSFPPGYNPPVQWNELYDNPEWYVTPGFKVDVRNSQDRDTRTHLYTLEAMHEEAAKARAHGCEAIYLDPGWDTAFGSFIWDEERLGPLADFVCKMKETYDLKVCLHCPLAPWVGWVSQTSSDTWPREARHPDVDANPDYRCRLCFCSEAYLDAAEERLLALCAQGVCFIMLDGNFWVGSCPSPDHGHGVPSTFKDHMQASFELCRRIKAQYPEILIELHDPLSGGARARWTPTYFGHDPRTGFDENWGFELMWDPFEDLSSGRARALYYYAQSCNVPVYLHIDMRMDNEHATAFWWYASTCRHLGFGGTHDNPNIRRVLEHAANRYRELERVFKVGTFHGVTEEVHIHVLPEENALVVNLFNLSDEPARIEESYPLTRLGIDLSLWYSTSNPAVVLDPGEGILRIGGKLPPWGTRVVELRAVSVHSK